MATRTLCLDDEAETILREIRAATGMSVSEALTRGLVTLRVVVRRERDRSPWDVYETIDLGSGGYTTGPASRSKESVRKSIRRKHKR